MSFFLTGNQPINSTQGTAADPSTATLIAELDSSNFGTQSTRTIQVQAHFYVGASTSALWWIEHATSTGLGSSAITDRLIVRTASGQHSQFAKRYLIGFGERLRIHVGSSFTGDADAKIQVEIIS